MEFLRCHIIEISALLIAFLSLIGSLYTYYRFNKKLKKQEILINDFQIDKNKKENEELNKAEIEANSNYNGKGNNTIYIYNKGKSEARNVNVIIPDEEDIFVINKDKLFPTNILPRNSVKFIIEASMNAPDKIDIILKWEDNFKKDNNKSQPIQLNI